MAALLAALSRSLRELCFPAVCLLCRDRLPAFAEVHLCDGCRVKIKLIRPPLCLCCGGEFVGEGGSHYCGGCLARTPHFSMARAILRYDEESAKLVYAFKYGGKTVGRATFQALAREVAPLADLAAPELIVPVPLHPKRLKERGFNQALVLARFLFPKQGQRIVTDLLCRTRWTEPQVALSGRQRRRNLAGAFTVQGRERIDGCRVLLVDDVYTTGTTLNECAKVLKEQGAVQVEALTLARVREIY